MYLNKVFLYGNLTRDPELKALPSGSNVANFGLATNRTYKDKSGAKQEATEFHNIVAWRRLAEICGQYLHKGSKIYLEGRLQTSSWDDQSGNKRYRTEVIADNMIMLDRKSDSAPRQEGQTYREEPPYSAPVQAMPQEDQSSEEEISVEDIPF